MNRICLLPEPVANQIAAGEVVERPASVVKELVENALDAGATRVTVEIRRGGRQLIRVTDDGLGMGRDDALLCLERHATSKIRTAHDLSEIRSMGFRGEALPSIASVSRFTLTTRERDSESPEAVQVIVHGGKILDVRTMGHPTGTTVEVAQLFYNLPARRKFLRSEETERSHIQHYLTLAALAHPEVGFTLRQEERTLWQLPPMPAGRELAEGVRERLRSLLGADLALVTVEATQALLGRGGAPDPAGDVEVRIWGFIGAPGVARSNRQDQHLFVNRRPVENRGLNFALLEGYHTALMKGRYPVCCLFLEIGPGEVDVNVHPAKREVRFHREIAVRNAVASAVQQALLAYHQAHTISRSGSDLASGSAVEGGSQSVPVGGGGEPAQAGELIRGDRESVDSRWLPALAPQPTRAEPSRVEVAGQTRRETAGSEDAAPAGAGEVSEQVDAPGESAEPVGGDGAEERPLLRVPLRLLGVVGRLYVVLESDRGMVLMDQHAAHERVLFEQMLRRLEKGPAPSQRLLLPETVELSIRDAQFLREHLEVLSRLGVGLGEFGERTFLLEALPPIVKVRDAKEFVRGLIDALAEAGREVNKMRLGEDVVAKTVCRHAVKANDPLAPLELEKLVEDLRGCAMPYTCPHGRPTLIEFGLRELERKFGRVQ